MADKWTNEEILYLQNNINQQTLEEISMHLNKTLSSIYHKMNRENIKNKNAWTNQDIEYLKQNYRTKTHAEMADALNRTKSAISLKLSRLGLKKEKYLYNCDFFEYIDSQEKAYWCGFIMADGCVSINKDTNSSELTITLSEKDSEHLQKFVSCLEGNIPIIHKNVLGKFNGREEKYYKMAQIRIYSKKIVNDLQQYNIEPAKTKIKTLPSNINDVFMRDYIRGYFDGNGSLGIYKSKIGCKITTGSYEFAKQLHLYINKHICKTGNIYINKDRRNGYESYNISIHKKEEIKNFLSYLYYNDEITYLERKYILVQSILNNFAS